MQHAFSGLLRIRTSLGFAISRPFGHLYPDPNHEHLFKLNFCDESVSLTFDFEFNSSAGFESGGLLSGSPGSPTVQMAYAYYFLPDKNSRDVNDKLVKRLRLVTKQQNVAPVLKYLLEGASLFQVFSTLTNKVSFSLTFSLSLSFFLFLNFFNF